MGRSASSEGVSAPLLMATRANVRRVCPAASRKVNKEPEKDFLCAFRACTREADAAGVARAAPWRKKPQHLRNARVRLASRRASHQSSNSDKCPFGRERASGSHQLVFCLSSIHSLAFASSR